MICNDLANFFLIICFNFFYIYLIWRKGLKGEFMSVVENKQKRYIALLLNCNFIMIITVRMHYIYSIMVFLLTFSTFYWPFCKQNFLTGNKHEQKKYTFRQISIANSHHLHIIVIAVKVWNPGHVYNAK